ncbi:uncharacterized protein [Anoplolepis gracilipes]|uniref:uncharacterized protein n=1 Tax=Anoplolepis gracilipes TaxID=354296 RepID=UPI003BA0F9B3
MVCRDFMLRVCRRNPCKIPHEVEKCTNTTCNNNNLCKRVHLSDDEIVEINQNIRPFRETIYQEMKRLAYVLRETFPKDLRVTTCTVNMLGECLWSCFACQTASRNIAETAPVCSKCYILLTEYNRNALKCGHVYCSYCIDRLPINVDGPLPLSKCNQCYQWAVQF